MAKGLVKRKRRMTEEGGKQGKVGGMRTKGVYYICV